MNTMFVNQNNLKNQIMDFANNIRASGKNPEDLLNEAISSGKYTPEQINNAKMLAEKFSKLLNLR